MKRILINATQQEELRVAIVDGQKLMDLDIETSSAGHKKGNIYKGVISRIEPGLDAAFVDYGDAKHGFLPFREISNAYFKNKTGGSNNPRAIAKSLNEGQALLVQVQREGHGGKGAALTTFISLAGRYLVLMPNNPRAGGVSRRADGKDRDATRQILAQLNLREEEGAIVRTKGIGSDIKLLQRDINYLRSLWDSIVSSAKSAAAPFLIYEESNIVICALRDHLSDNTEEILVDTEKVFNDAHNFVKLIMPHHLSKLKRYQGAVPLFNHYQIESQIETAFDREIALPSGGSVVFDRTEALLSIDINSGKATRGSNIEETALNTNLEATEEIARQLRLRDLGGLIVIDFIDMMSVGNRKAVENRLHQLVNQDQARVQFERISRFGLLEMSRQRLRPSLSESSHLVCPRCNGKGFIRTLESGALSTLRMIEEEAMKEKSGRVVAQLPIEMSSFLLNEKREMINTIERRHNVQLVIVPDAQMQTPHFQIRRYRIDDHENIDKYSYEMITERKPALAHVKASTQTRETPVVGPAVDFIGSGKMPSENRTSKWLSALTSLFHKPTPPPAANEIKGSGSRSRRRGGRRRGGRSQERSSAAEPRRNHRLPSSGERTGKPAFSNDRPADSRSGRGSGRSRRGTSASSRRRTPEYGTPDTSRGSTRDTTPRAQRPDPRRRERDMTPPPHVVDQPRAGGGNGTTMFTPPMPILPDTPPPQARRDDSDADTTHSTQPILPPAPPSASASGDTPPNDSQPTAASPPTGNESESHPSKVATPATHEQTVQPTTHQPQPVPYSPPRFSKPSHLTQVETKSTSSDKSEPKPD